MCRSRLLYRCACIRYMRPPLHQHGTTGASTPARGPALPAPPPVSRQVPSTRSLLDVTIDLTLALPRFSRAHATASAPRRGGGGGGLVRVFGLC